MVRIYREPFMLNVPMSRSQFMNKRIALTIMAAAVIWAFPLTARPQTTGASVSGIVRNPHRAAVAGGKVTITNLATNQLHNALTGSDGSYYVPSLVVSTYQFVVEANGYDK